MTDGEKPSCCCCFDIEIGMKILAVLYVLAPLFQVNNFLKFMSTGFWLFIILGLMDFAPRLIMAFFWGKWLKEQDTNATVQLVAANRCVFFYYCFFVVIFLGSCYAFIGTVIGMLLGSKGTTKEDQANVAALGFYVCAFVTFVATFGLCVFYYFYTVAIKYATW